MSFLKNWILGVTACALAVALAQALTPEGTVKKIGRLVGGMALLLAVIRPLLGRDPAEYLPRLVPAAALTRGEAARGGEETLKTLIAEKVGAYIVDKGQSLGCAVARVEVTVDDDGSGWPAPWSAVIAGRWTEEQRQALSEAVEEELAIPAGRQSFQEEGT